MNFRYQENLMAVRGANSSPRRQCLTCPRTQGWPVMPTLVKAAVEVGNALAVHLISTLDNFNDKSNHGYRKRVILAS